MAPKGYSQFSLPTGVDKDIFGLLKSQLMQSGPGAFSQLGGMAQGSPELFDQLEAPAMRQFQQQILPGIANRYVGSGIGNSSGMQNSFAGAGRDLAENLQSQRLGYQQNATQQIMGLMNLLLSHPAQQTGLVQKQNIGYDLLKLLGSGVGMGIGNIPNMFKL